MPGMTMEGRTFSHYRVIAHLGGGGMGVVYQAEDVRLKRQVALKFLPTEMTRDPDARDRFIQEAQAASALDHPNICTIYDVDTADDGQLFIAMAYYDGETLKQRLRRGPLPVADALDIALQIARGLENAHHAGIVHRDIKPANLIVTHDGTVKIVDFGIAKLVDQTGPTKTGTTLGTVGYMAPEQVRGTLADQRVDLWALGVVLYEMLAGTPPFLGQNDAIIINNILNVEPAPIRSVRPEASPDVERIIRRALAKPIDQRYPTAADLIADLGDTHAAVTGRHTAVTAAPSGVAPKLAIAAAAVVIAAAAGVGGWLFKRNADARRVDALVADATAFAAKDQNAAALALVEQAERLAPADPRLAALTDRVSVHRTIRTDPPGAQVSIKEYSAVTGAWTPLGETPVVDRRVPRTPLRWKIVKPGFEPIEALSSPNPNVQFRLVPTGSIPPNMVAIQRPQLSLFLNGYDYTRAIPAPDYAIDKYEVTNKQFKAFVDAGGYTRREYWTEPFVRDGRTISWDEAVAVFRDRTGRPGPATWEVGTYPAGHEDDPVGGVSWYEAVAYARFAGKSLPTIYHWLTAATGGGAAYITPFSNYDGKGPAAVGKYLGVTGYGAYDMAGNLKEWCWNEVSPGGARYTLGGSWSDPPHMYGYADARPAFDRAEVNGFRLVKYLGDKPIDPELSAAIPVPSRDFSREHPVSDQVFQVYRSLYAYDPRPLDVKTEARDDSDPQWTREKVSFTAAYGNERVTAYVWIPKTGHPPFQTVVAAPGANAIAIRRSTSLPTSMLDFLVVSGRAVILPIYQGTYERGNGRTSPWPELTRAYKDWMVQVAMDGRRTVDYIATRSEMKQDSIGYYGSSWGAMFGPLVLATEPRFRAAVLADGGLSSTNSKPPEVDQFNFAPRVTLPVLMVNGDSDYIYQLETAQKPLFALLGAPADRKRHVVFHSGHSVINQQRSQVVKEILDWFDQYLGPVNR